MDTKFPDPSPMHDPDQDGSLAGRYRSAQVLETRPPSAWTVLAGVILILVTGPIAWGMTWHFASIAVGRPWWDDDLPPTPGRPSFGEAFPPLAGGGVAFPLATFIAYFFFGDVPCSPKPPGWDKPR